MGAQSAPKPSEDSGPPSAPKLCQGSAPGHELCCGCGRLGKVGSKEWDLVGAVEAAVLGKGAPRPTPALAQVAAAPRLHPNFAAPRGARGGTRLLSSRECGLTHLQ